MGDPRRAAFEMAMVCNGLLDRARTEAKAADQRLDLDLAWDHAWLAQHCAGAGWQAHPALAGAGLDRDRGIAIAGAIVDGRGVVASLRGDSPIV